MAILRTDPFLIDINLVSSTDFQIHLSDYVELLNSFADEVGLNSIYWHTDSHSDPTTSKINFYEQLNNNSVQIAENPDGVKKRDVVGDDLKNKNYRDQLPPGSSLKTDTNSKYGKPDVSGSTANATRSTTEKKWVVTDGGDDTNPGATGKWVTNTTTKNVTHNVTPHLSIQDSPPSFSQAFGMKDMSAWFKLWWIEKFNTSHHVIKDQLKGMLGESNEYFCSFSESVGQLKNVFDAYDTSTLPVWDQDVEAFGTKYSIPSTIAGTAKYCMQPESLALAQQLSKNTNKVFRYNLVNMMEDASRDTITTGPMVSFPTMPHGNNFVHDVNHSSRIFQNLDKISDVLQQHLKGLYDVLELLSDRENYMVVDKPKQILLKVEDFTCSVDRLKQKIKSFEITNTKGTNTRYGKHTRYNNNKTNDNVLS